MHRIAPGGLSLLLLIAAPTVARPDDEAAQAKPEKGAPAPAGQGRKPIDVSEGYIPEEDPPPGSPADVALWKSGYDAGRAVRGAKNEADRVNRRAHFSRVEGRLKAAARRAPPEEAVRYERLLQDFQLKWRDQFTLMWSTWPVESVRACDNQILAFDTALRSAAGGSRKTDVGNAREKLRTCVEKGRSVAASMTQKNQALAAAIDAGLAATAALDAAGKESAKAEPGPGKAEKGEAREKVEEGTVHEKGEKGQPKAEAREPKPLGT